MTAVASTADETPTRWSFGPGWSAVLLAVAAVTGTAVSLLLQRYPNWAPTVMFILFFLLSFIVIVRRDAVMAIFYSVLFVYTLFTQLGYLIFPARFTRLNGLRFFPLAEVHRYVLFVGLSFAAIFVLFLVSGIRAPRPRLVLKASRISRSLSWWVFQVVIAGHTVVSALFVTVFGATLSYSGQENLKSNPAFFYLYYLHAIILVVLYALLGTERSRTRRLFLMGGLLTNGAVFLLVSIKTGQRSELLAILVAGLAIKWMRTPRHRRLGVALTVLLVMVVTMVFGFALRFTRGEATSLDTFVSRSTEVVQYCEGCGPSDPFDVQNLILEDYSGPSVTLLYAMSDNIVDPAAVATSVAANSIILTDVPTLGEVVSRRINPAAGGFGFYFLAEGFIALGWWGILYNALIFVGGLRLWGAFRGVDDIGWEHFITGLLALAIFDIVRAQSSFFILGLYLLILPGIALYLLGRGVAITRRDGAGATI